MDTYLEEKLLHAKARTSAINYGIHLISLLICAGADYQDASSMQRPLQFCNYGVMLYVVHINY